MTEKTMILYVADEEYARRLLRYLSGRRRPGLRIERVTEREDFWARRKRDAADETLYWLTDDSEGCRRDPQGIAHRVLLSEETDEALQRISFCKRADVLYRDLMSWMEIADTPSDREGAPPPGVYALFSPRGEEGMLTAALLAQELSGYGACAYVNMSAFPHFYETAERQERHRLGELFFRLECGDYERLVRESGMAYGGAIRLPTVAHYRDLWDIGERDRRRFLERLNDDCHFPYVVVVFNDIREAMPALSYTTRFFLMMRPGGESALGRWNRYAATEHADADMVKAVTMPEGWERWMTELETTGPETWLQDEKKKRFISRLWREEDYHGGGRGERN